MRRARQSILEHRLVLAVGLLAAVPVILSLVRTLASGWTPVGDDAVIATRSLDVLTTHPPLLGQYSQSSVIVAAASYSLGPLLYWLLAIPVRLSASVGLALTMCVVNAACVIGCVALARRRGGNALMVATAIAFVVMSGSLVSRTYNDIWNPAAGLLPFTLLIFLSWSIACGEYRLLPVTVLVASFVVQCHLTYGPPSLGLLIVALAGLLSSSGLDRRALRRWALIAAGVGVLCWIAPLVDQAVHRPGNLVEVAKAAFNSHPTIGWRLGWHALVRGVGVPPWWLRIAHGPDDRLLEVFPPLSVLRSVSCALILAGLVAITAAAWRARRRDVVAAAASALVLCGTLALVTASTPRTGLLPFTLGYTLWWGSPAGMFVWLVLGWSIATLVPGVRTRLAAFPVSWRAAAVGLGTALAVVTLVRAGAGQDVTKSRYGPVKTLAARLRHDLTGGRTVLVEAASTSGFDPLYDFEAGLLYDLRRDGTRVVTGTLGTSLGKYYDAKRHPSQVVLHLEHPGVGPPPPPGTLVGRVTLSKRPTRPTDVIVATLAPAAGR